jgi:hypothetical protein
MDRLQFIYAAEEHRTWKSHQTFGVGILHAEQQIEIPAIHKVCDVV